MTFNGRFLANVIQFASTQGASAKDLIALTKLDLPELSDMDTKVDASVYNAVLEKAVLQTQNERLGLHLGNYLSLSAAGLIVQIAQNSETVEEGLNYAIQFANLGCAALPFSLVKEKSKASIQVMPSELWMKQSPVAVEQTLDGYFVFTLREFHSLTHRKFRPIAVNFKRKRPESYLEIEKVFNCPVYFNREIDSIEFDASVLKEKVVTSDYNLLKVLVQHAESKLAQMVESNGYVHIVKQSIINLVKPQFPTLEQVADNLNISSRTLQRKLKEENQTFKSVLNEIKKQWAKDYLQNPSLSIKEISYLLDYSEPSAFVRSFKKWTGKSPNSYRSELI